MLEIQSAFTGKHQAFTVSHCLLLLTGRRAAYLSYGHCRGFAFVLKIYGGSCAPKFGAGLWRLGRSLIFVHTATGSGIPLRLSRV
jgi:hypothetical protein